MRRAHQQDEGESPGTTSPAVRAVRPLAEAGDDRGEDGGRPGRPAPRSGSLERREARRGEEWVVRPVAGAGGKAYRCPGCDQEIAPGVPHVVVSLADGNVDDRRHWHTACWNAQDRRTGKLRRSAPSSLRHPL
ncbi:ATP/GTP-binding protein [Streptomyces sp. NPDC017936]|uniref:ATP/GTP-binding protein n=1 Tax=Streptomyces sp. NPDC017936 TaxID=3365016 RepID=UPI0037A86669